MVFLIVSVSAATVFGQLLKWAVVRKTDLYVVTAANYVAAATFALVAGLAGGESWGESVGLLYVTAPGGLFFVASFVTWLWSMQRGGLYVSSVVFQLAAAVPVVAALVIWREMPEARHWAGLAILIPALVVLSHKRAASVKSEKAWSPALALALFATTGLALVAIKAKSHLELQSVSFLYFHWIFGVAGVGAIAMCVVTRAKVSRFAVLVGIAVGVTNFLTVMALSWALGAETPAYIVFPVQAAGSIFTATTLALVFWKETFSWRGGVGLACALVAVVLLTI